MSLIMTRRKKVDKKETCMSSLVLPLQLNLSLPSFRDDTFSDTLSQKADSEASSGPVTEDKSSSKDMNSPTDRHSDSYLARSVGLVCPACVLPSSPEPHSLILALLPTVTPSASSLSLNVQAKEKRRANPSVQASRPNQ